MAPTRRVLVLVVLVGVLAPARGAAARGNLKDVEKEFREAIGKVVPAAVVCLPWGVKPEQAGLGSSGVIITRSGFVLSDGDAGVIPQQGGQGTASYAPEVEVRVPDLEEGGFRAYRATVVRRVRDVDTSLLKIVDVPAGGFPEAIVPGRSDHLQIGDYTFVTGNAFGGSREAPPATTAGIVASMSDLPPDDAGGRREYIYTSAAVNPGVNGGPVVDVEGRLVGTVSTFLPPLPDQPFQFLGKVVPIDRIRAAYSDLSEAAEAFPPVANDRERAKESAALEIVYRHAARRTYPNVVSLAVERSRPLSTHSPGQGGVFPVPRYQGPVSGIALDRDGWILTSLANLTNVASLVFSGAGFPRWNPPPEHDVEPGLADVKGVTVYWPDGRKAPARVVAYDGRSGIALLKAEMPDDTTAPAVGALGVVPAPREAFVEGRLVVAVGNPFGDKPHPDPLTTVGVLSKVHAEDTLAAWRGQWQTDVGATDANCGGAVVDLQGRLLGLLQVWSPPMFGRNSGIAFLVPWSRIEAVLPDLKAGQSTVRGFLGVSWTQGREEAVIGGVVPSSPAEAAGFRVGDRITRIDGVETPSLQDVVTQLAVRFSGEAVRVQVDRHGTPAELEVVLGRRPP